MKLLNLKFFIILSVMFYSVICISSTTSRDLKQNSRLILNILFLANSYIEKGQSLSICVSGDIHLLKTLDRQSRDLFKFSVHRVKKSSTQKCHALFLGTNSMLAEKVIINYLKNKTIIMTDNDKKFTRYAVITFVERANDLYFKVNKKLLDHFNIEMNSKVLRAAREVI